MEDDAVRVPLILRLEVHAKDGTVVRTFEESRVFVLPADTAPEAVV